MSVKVSVLGATGYGGGELIRLLSRHPGVELVAVTSRSREGVPVSAIHKNLEGLTDLCFSTPGEDELVERSDVIVGAMPHGASAEVLAPLVDRGAKVVDLSGDFRLRDAATYARWYKREHPRHDLMQHAVYGCPEAHREAMRGARLIASPGCFATAINLALLPAAPSLAGQPVVVAMTGSSGSGADASAGTHHPTRAQTLRPYKVLAHQHTPECVQLLQQHGADALEGLVFTPVSAPLVRGIVAVVTAPLIPGADPEAVADRYRAFYATHPFVKVLASREPECAPIAGTNYAEVRARATADGRLHVVCAIDNLVKGGAGQGVQALNLMMGLDEEQGLDWPGTWP